MQTVLMCRHLGIIRLSGDDVIIVCNCGWLVTICNSCSYGRGHTIVTSGSSTLIHTCMVQTYYMYKPPVVYSQFTSQFHLLQWQTFSSLCLQTRWNSTPLVWNLLKSRLGLSEKRWASTLEPIHWFPMRIGSLLQAYYLSSHTSHEDTYKWNIF